MARAIFPVSSDDSPLKSTLYERKEVEIRCKGRPQASQEEWLLLRRWAKLPNRREQFPLTQEVNLLRGQMNVCPRHPYYRHRNQELKRSLIVWLLLSQCHIHQAAKQILAQTLDHHPYYRMGKLA
jgi:hypothetical protein